MWYELRTGNRSNCLYECNELRPYRSQFPNRKGELTRSDILKIFRLEKFQKFLIPVQIFCSLGQDFECVWNTTIYVYEDVGFQMNPTT